MCLDVCASNAVCHGHRMAGGVHSTPPWVEWCFPLLLPLFLRATTSSVVLPYGPRLRLFHVHTTANLSGLFPLCIWTTKFSPRLPPCFRFASKLCIIFTASCTLFRTRRRFRHPRTICHDTSTVQNHNNKQQTTKKRHGKILAYLSSQRSGPLLLPSRRHSLLCHRHPPRGVMDPSTSLVLLPHHRPRREHRPVGAFLHCR